MLHQRLVTSQLPLTRLEGGAFAISARTRAGYAPAPSMSERLGASSSSAVPYAGLQGLVSLLVFGLSILANQLQNGSIQLTGPWVVYTGVAQIVVYYLLTWGYHFVQTGDWSPVILPTPEPPPVPPVFDPVPAPKLIPTDPLPVTREQERPPAPPPPPSGPPTLTY